MGSGSGSVSTTPPSAGLAGGRPARLTIQTNMGGEQTMPEQQQYKSAYPTFNPHNGGVPAPSGEEVTVRSPGPVTAGPDFGRHANARLDIVGSQVCSAMPYIHCDCARSETLVTDCLQFSCVLRLPLQRGGPKTAVNPNVRHSFNGSDIQFDLGSVTTTPTAANPNANSQPPENAMVSRINGHVRSGSAGNWSTATAPTRTSHLMAYPLSSIPGASVGESPWDYSVNNSSRLAGLSNGA